MNLNDNLKTVIYPSVWMPQDFVLRSSQMGRCLRGQVLNALGFRGSFSAATMALMDAGTSTHEIIQRSVPAFWPESDFEVEFVKQIGNINVRTHIDIVHESDGYEIKTYGYKNNYAIGDDVLTKPWRWQVELTHRISGLNMSLFATGRPFPLGQVSILYIEPSDELWDRILADVAAVAIFRHTKTIPDRPGDKKECSDCGYAKICASINIGHLDPWGDVPPQLETENLSYIKTVETERDKYDPEVRT